MWGSCFVSVAVFCLNDTATTEIYTYGHTLSLHDALPIFAEDLAAGLLGQLAQADEGGVADSADKTVADVHFFFFLDEAPVPEQGWRPAGPRVAARTEGVQGLVSAEAHALTVDYFQIRMIRSEEHTSELQSLMRISYAVFCLKTKKKSITNL